MVDAYRSTESTPATGRNGSATRGRARKSAAAFRTISEVASELDVPQHVLRFWETKFAQVRPVKRGGGRRYYRPEDIDLLRRIRNLLYTEGYTIRGVQRLLRDSANGRNGSAADDDAAEAPTQPVAARSSPVPPPMPQEKREVLKELLDELQDLRDMLDEAD